MRKAYAFSIVNYQFSIKKQAFGCVIYFGLEEMFFNKTSLFYWNGYFKNQD